MLRAMQSVWDRWSSRMRACISPGCALEANSNLRAEGGNRRVMKFLRLRAERKAKTSRDSSSTDVRKGASLLFDNQPAEMLILDELQPGIGGKDRHRRNARAPHQLRIAFQVANFSLSSING